MQSPRLLIIQTTLGVMPRHNSALGDIGARDQVCPTDSTNKLVGIGLVLFSIGEALYWSFIV